MNTTLTSHGKWCDKKSNSWPALLVVFICLAGHLHAQQPVVWTYSVNAADEDWSFLKERSKLFPGNGYSGQVGFSGRRT
jgi:hypothetical protein